MNRNFEEFKNNTKDLFYFLINIKIYTEEKWLATVWHMSMNDYSVSDVLHFYKRI